ncbi:hypothetical protein Cfor_03146, partial [Coptotermes formosanus]
WYSIFPVRFGPNCQMSNYHNDGCNDSHACVCCRTVKYIFGVSGVDLFLCNGVVYNE